MTAVAAAATARSVPVSVRIPAAHQSLCSANVLVMERLDGRALGAIAPTEQIGDRQALARTLFDTLLGEVMIEGIFHADPHPGNVLLLADGQLGLLDFGSVGRIDAGLRSALQRLLLAVDRRDPASLNDALLEVVQRPDELDEPALERALGQFMARHVGPGITPDVRMFTDLFWIVAEHELSVPPEIAGAFGALATIEGTLTGLAPGFDILTEARSFTTDYLADQLSPEAPRLHLGETETRFHSCTSILLRGDEEPAPRGIRARVLATLLLTLTIRWTRKSVALRPRFPIVAFPAPSSQLPLLALDDKNTRSRSLNPRR